MPCGFCNFGQTAATVPAERMVCPPTVGDFSARKMFLAPACIAAHAAQSPAPPDPTMTISAEMVSTEEAKVGSGDKANA